MAQRTQAAPGSSAPSVSAPLKVLRNRRGCARLGAKRARRRAAEAPRSPAASRRCGRSARSGGAAQAMLQAAARSWRGPMCGAACGPTRAGLLPLEGAKIALCVPGGAALKRGGQGAEMGARGSAGCGRRRSERSPGVTASGRRSVRGALTGGRRGVCEAREGEKRPGEALGFAEAVRCNGNGKQRRGAKNFHSGRRVVQRSSEARSCAPNFCRGIAAFLPSPPGKGGGARGPGL